MDLDPSFRRPAAQAHSARAATNQTVWVVLASGCGPAGGDALGGGASYLLRSPFFCASSVACFRGQKER